MDTLVFMAERWADELKNEKVEDVRQAFLEHARRHRFFPSLASILELLPAVRSLAPQQRVPQLPEITRPTSEHQAWQLGWCKLIKARISRDPALRERSEVAYNRVRSLLDAGMHVTTADLQF